MSNIYADISVQVARIGVLALDQNAKAGNAAFVPEAKTLCLGSKHSTAELHPHRLVEKFITYIQQGQVVIAWDNISMVERYSASLQFDDALKPIMILTSIAKRVL